jgi:hypothetical protein
MVAASKGSAFSQSVVYWQASKRITVMTARELQSFADNYAAEDFERISFQWNGGYGNEFSDTNSDFRIQLCEFLIPHIQHAKLELLRDLYQELGKTSEYTFGCYNKFHLIGQELLERGGIPYLTAYLEGSAHTMDTALMSGRIVLSKERAKELFAYFESKAKSPENDQEAKFYGDYFRKRFERMANS